jgi:uncharacterized protein YcnI
MNNTAPARRRTLTIAGVVTGLALVVGTPLAASAHVHVDPGEATAGSTETLAFSFSHGCDGAATTALVVDIPDAVATVTPILDGAWTVTRELGDDGIANRVVYTATTPVEDGLKASVSMEVVFGEASADSLVPFPVTQTCTEGESAWVEVAEDGQSADDLDSPAPAVSVGAFVEADGHGRADDDTEQAEHAEASDTAAASSALPLWLSGGALVASLAALGVALMRGRSRQG